MLTKKESKKLSVKRGSVTVWIYHTPSGAHDGWTVVHYETDGRRVRTYRSILADAKLFAEQTATRLAGIQNAADSLTDQEALDAAEARKITGDRSLVTVARAYDGILKRLGDTPPDVAIDYYLAHRKTSLTAAPAFSKVLSELVAAGRQDGLSDRHLDSVEDRLTKIGNEFKGTISALDSTMMDELLRNLQKKFKWSGRTRNHYRASLSNLMHFAKRKGYLPRDWNEMEFVPKAIEEDGEIGVYTAADLKKILDKCEDKDLLPFVVLGAFAGPRPSEITHLDWADIHFDSGEIFIGKGKVRKAGHRIAPLGLACAAWLTPIKKKKGYITRLTDYSHPLQDLLKAAEVDSIHDGLRHSFVSYRQATIKNLAQVSSETGTDQDTLTRKYCRPVKKEDAEAWFQVFPS